MSPRDSRVQASNGLAVQTSAKTKAVRSVCFILALFFGLGLAGALSNSGLYSLETHAAPETSKEPRNFIISYTIAQAGDSPVQNNGENGPKNEQTQSPRSGQEDGRKDGRSEFEILLDQELEGRTPAPAQPEATSWPEQILKTAVVLLVMIALFYGFWKLNLFRRQFPGQSSEVFRTLHQAPLSPGKSLQIVELGNRLLVLGISDAGIQLVTEFTEKAAIDRIKLECDRDNDRDKPDFWIELSKSISTTISGALGGEKTGAGQPGQSGRQEKSKPPWEKLRSGAKKNMDKIRTDKDFFRD